MIIYHEDLEREAEEIAKSANKVFSECEVFSERPEIENRELSTLFDPIERFPDGFAFRTLQKGSRKLRPPLNEATIEMVVTPRDIYDPSIKNAEDALYYAENKSSEKWGSKIVVSVARLKSEDGSVSEGLEVPESHYLKRVAFWGVHELGHDLIDEDEADFKDVYAVNAKTGRKYSYGPHCPDNRCVMYEAIRIKTPDPAERFMLFEGECGGGGGGGGDCGESEPRYDGGLDDILERLYPNWLCEKCGIARKTVSYT